MTTSPEPIFEHPELLALYRTHVLSPRVEQIRALVERARERGEIGDTPTDIAAAMIAGPLFLHALTVLADADVRMPDRAAEALTRAILDGIAATRRRPDRPPTRDGRPAYGVVIARFRRRK
jgi:AcrR family transcriptional regulator